MPTFSTILPACQVHHCCANIGRTEYVQRKTSPHTQVTEGGEHIKLLIEQHVPMNASTVPFHHCIALQCYSFLKADTSWFIFTHLTHQLSFGGLKYRNVIQQPIRYCVHFNPQAACERDSSNHFAYQPRGNFIVRSPRGAIIVAAVGRISYNQIARYARACVVCVRACANRHKPVSAWEKRCNMCLSSFATRCLGHINDDTQPIHEPPMKF